MAVHDFTTDSVQSEQQNGSPAEVQPPPESLILNAAYKKSGLTVADLATATGLSVGAIRIALSGLRYRSGQPKPTVPPDQTLALLASALGVPATILSSIDRGRAGEMLTEAKNQTAKPDLDTTAAIAAREGLARQVLAVFSSAELQAELRRRSESDR